MDSPRVLMPIIPIPAMASLDEGYETVEEDEDVFLTARSSNSADDEVSSPNISLDCIVDDSEEEDSTSNVLFSPRDGSVHSDMRGIFALENVESKNDELSIKDALVDAISNAFTDNKDELGFPCDGAVLQDDGEIPLVGNVEIENEQLVDEDLLNAPYEAREYPLPEGSENDYQEDHSAKEEQFHGFGELTQFGSEASDEDSYSSMKSSELPVTKCGKKPTGERTPDTRDDNTRALDTSSCSSMEALDAIKQKPSRKNRRESTQIWVPKSPTTQFQPARRHSRRRSTQMWIPKAEWAEYLTELRK